MTHKNNQNLMPRVFWISSIVLILAIGVFCFPREFKELGFVESVYYTIRLFVLEQDLPRFPQSVPLILIYFAAPLVSISAVWYFLKYLFNISPVLKTRWMNNHVVIAGMGRTGKLITSTLEKNGVKVVGIDQGPAGSFEDWFCQHKSPVLFGDFNSQRLIKKARADHARSIVFATGDDLANLEGAVAAYDQLKTSEGPVRLIWTHVADERLANTARDAVRTRGVVCIRFFDTYRIAATKMVNTYFNKEARKGVTKVTVIGFGKFGQDLVEILISDMGPEDNFTIHIVDLRDLSSQIEMMVAELGIVDRVSFTQSDIREMHLVDEIDEAFFICTDDDLGNITAAMMLAKKIECTHIYVRMTTWPLSAMAEHLGEDRGIFFININDLVVQGMGQLPGLLEAPTQAHLKRTD